MVRVQIVLFSALMALITGCASSMQARNVQPSGFLGEHRSLLNDVADDGATLKAYRNPQVNWSSYHKILLQPVVIWDGFSSTLSQEQRDDLQGIANTFYNKLYLKLSKDYQMVEQSEAGTMRLQISITHAEQSWVAPALLSKISLELQVLNTVWTYFSGKPAFAGEISFEFTAHDAQTAELLVAGADRRVGGQNLIDKELFNAWGDAKNSVEFWSDLSAYQFCVLRKATGCNQPKA